MTPGELTFGTAGIRGEVGPGRGQMNVELVQRFAWALGTFLHEHRPVRTVSVVVGFDARPTSREFAQRISSVLSALGARVWLSSEAIPTPLLAFSVRQLGAAAGVVVTASHNPRGDNGIKVYDQRGAQIGAPWDSEIAKRMELASPPFAEDELGVAPLPQSVETAYFEYLRELGEVTVPLSDASPKPRAEPLAYTPLHGVGLSFVERALAQQNVALVPVPSQAAPDGTFPTLPFPNPEEPHALDLLLETAESCGARVAFASDPDADRFAVCLPLLSPQGSLVRLDGDAVGLLFADAAITAHGSNVSLVSTVVSSPGLDALAALSGARVIRTLTGFKWMAAAALQADRFVFAYEEALGYCFALRPGEVPVLDKDGVGAALLFCRLLEKWGGPEGLVARLMDLYKSTGQWGSFGASRRYLGEQPLQQMDAKMADLRAACPEVLSGFRVEKVLDYLQGASRDSESVLQQNLLELHLEAESEPSPGDPLRARVLIRPSGTEPKIKVYVHLLTPLSEAGDYAPQRARQQEVAARIVGSFLREQRSLRRGK